MRRSGPVFILLCLVAWICATNHVALGYCACEDGLVIVECPCAGEEESCGFDACVDGWAVLTTPDFVRGSVMADHPTAPLLVCLAVLPAPVALRDTAPPAALAGPARPWPVARGPDGIRLLAQSYLL